jgi:phosphopantothenoylcysteine decarboxylase / phosphopantothenate---cysteine ligase
LKLWKKLKENMMLLQGKKILIGITGSIAAYKMPMLIRLLVKEGAEVKIIATQGALQFVTPIVLNTLSNHKAIVSLTTEDSWNNHVHLSRWADVFLIAPLSCNTLAKMANGYCDNAFMAVYLSATCSIIASPAMDEDMWLHATTKDNIKRIAAHGVKVLMPETGSLASGLVGIGRMPEIETLFTEFVNFFNKPKKLLGKRVLITAGPTHQPIDPVRFIGNRSSGKMGLAIANSCAQEGAEVVLVYGPGTAMIPNNIHMVIRVETAEEMYNICMQHNADADIMIMCAAVADYTPKHVADVKIKKASQELTIELAKTQDILATLGQQKKHNQLLVGFALETNDEAVYAKDKLDRKNADIIVMNSMRDTGSGFGVDTNKVTLFSKKYDVQELPLLHKEEVAQHIVTFIINY